ncbi:curli assembly protein CsgF [Christiangramia sp. LLG6405-1]|uniref:curli assembly protein CsgF n=1 Tax=Christiangramia sp. LLG6405-1 TaxID=3160832 RepID=UPI003864E6ED
MKIRLLIFFVLLTGIEAYSQQLTYTPTNPAFGGSYLNYSWMLSSATVQNGLKARTDPSSQQSELETLGQDINRQVLSQISRTLLQQQLEGFGNFDQEGTFSYGNLTLEIYRTLEGLVINILDTTTGEETQIIVPYN